MNQNSGKCILTHKVRDIAKLAVCPKLDSQESSLPVSAHKTNEASTREGAGFCYSVGLSPVAGEIFSMRSSTAVEMNLLRLSPIASAAFWISSLRPFFTTKLIRS